MTNFFIDPRVTDPDLLDDVTLAADVIRQTSTSGDALTQEEVDELLGLRPPKGDS